MKKVTILSLLSVVIIIFVILLLNLSGKKPFKVLQMDDVIKVEVLVQPPNTTKEISDSAQIQKLVEILNNVTIYKKDNSWREYSGQYVQYTITKKNREVITIGAYNPFLIIDDIGYKTKYQPCEDLNALANSIIGD